ncbi:MAG: GumC family protein [Bacteroidales bacterium]
MKPSTSRKSTRGAAESDTHVFDYLRVLYRRRWVALPVFLVLFVTSAINTVRTTPIYEAKTEILIEKDGAKGGNINDLFQQQEGWYNDDFYQTQYKMLQSRTLARRAIVELKMGDRPDLDGGVKVQGGFSLTGLVFSGIGAVRGLINSNNSQATTSRPADEKAWQSAVIDDYLGRLTVVPIRNSRLVDLKFVSASPQMAMKMANALAEAYIRQNLELRFTTNKEANVWLSDQVNEQKKKVEEAEQALQNYKEQNDAAAVDDRQNIVVQKLADLNAAVTKAKTERFGKEAVYRQLQSMDANGSIDTFPAVLSNEYIQKIKSELADLYRQRSQLLDKYGEKWPDVTKVNLAIQGAEAKLKAETSKITASVRAEYESALANERSLVGALESQKNESLSLGRKSIEYSVLQRNAQSNRQIYESLLQRTSETGISSKVEATNIRQVDKAEPPRVPILPRTGRDLTLAFLIAAFCGVGLAFGFEYLDNRIKSPDEVKLHLDLPFLGMIPTVKDHADRALINNGVPAEFSESFQSVRTSVLFSSADQGAHKLVVTSTGPGEGKSLVASNMAMALAQAGQRVLLIDGDMRRPRVHEIFGENQEPGLSNVLTAQSLLPECVRKTAVDKLFVLPAGVIPPNPAELLASKRFAEFLLGLNAAYDWVVIDSPPVLAVADAAIYATTASGVLFVVAADRTTRQAARAALDQLHAVDAKMIGAVLNGVNITRNPYYYSHYYRKDYKRYYVKDTHANN